MDLAFIQSLIYGHFFSKGVDSAMAVSEIHINEKEFANILDRFDRQFIENNDAEITLNGFDMQSLVGKRACLIPLAEKYISQDNADISRNLKKDFISTASGEIFGHTNWEKERASEVVEKYLGYFYDLVFMKKISGIPDDYRAVINSYANTQHDINQDNARRIKHLETRKSLSQSNESTPVDFKLYYEEVERKFTAKKKGEYRNLVGEEPDETSYIDIFIKKEEEQVPVLPFLEKWFEKTEPGVILIHGEPGHGKTTLCSKASFEFYKGKFLKEKAANVVAVSLNTGKNPRIVKDGKVKLSNALVFQVGADDEKTFSFKECHRSLLFLDGFDEFIDRAKEANIDNICSFIEIVDDIADRYGIHIVILSRTIAVTKDLRDLDGNYDYYRLSPLSDEQQDKWLKQHDEYSGYKEAFNNLRNNEDMKRLLEVPLLFRLIVNSRFETVTSNIVEMYDDLFAHLMHKRNIYNEKIKSVNDGLMNLAFEVYCTDTNMARMDWDPQWLFAFYVESVDGDRIGFFHRTFYQYFLAKYIYSGVIKIKADNVKDFIGSFAERELDVTVHQYLSMMVDKKEMEQIHSNLDLAIEALIKSEAYLNLEPRIPYGNAEKTKIGRTTNIYRNTLQLCATFSHCIPASFSENLASFLRFYSSEGIVLYSDEKSFRACLSNADLEGAKLNKANLEGAELHTSILRRVDLSGANLSKADLSFSSMCFSNLFRANLSRANLILANLTNTILTKANLSGADLRGAGLTGADLNGINLEGADLRGVNLRRAELIRADLRGANLTGVDLRQADLRGANLSRANLSGSYFSENFMSIVAQRKADLNRADLSEADMSGANLSGVKIEYANLSSANLMGAVLENADMRGADLNRADLSHAILRLANLCEANLSGAHLKNTDLSGADISGALIEIKYKKIIDQSINGYDSVRWVSDERP